MPRLSTLARDLIPEMAFTVLARARALKAEGRDIVELEIGDSPFPSTPHAKETGIRGIQENRTGYGPSIGIPELREAAAKALRAEFFIPVDATNIVVASGAKPFEQFWAESLLEPGDGVLIFAPQFPTYVPNLMRRGARPVFAPLKAEHQFRPRADDIANFLNTDPKPRGVILNSPHNPTGGMATESDLQAIANVIRGTDLVVLSDEPYCHMVWKDRHHSLLAQPGMMDHVLAAYTFSKSYSMSGWRIGFAAGHPDVIDAIGNLINTTASCSPPFVQLAAVAALQFDGATRDDYMNRFRKKVERLSSGLAAIDGITVEQPAGTFYVFPGVHAICERLGLTSSGVAQFLMEGADEKFGVACLGGEAFGPEGAGFLRFSCAETDERIDAAIDFLPKALGQVERARGFGKSHPQLLLANR